MMFDERRAHPAVTAPQGKHLRWVQAFIHFSFLLLLGFSFQPVFTPEVEETEIEETDSEVGEGLSRKRLKTLPPPKEAGGPDPSFVSQIGPELEHTNLPSLCTSCQKVPQKRHGFQHTAWHIALFLGDSSPPTFL